MAFKQRKGEKAYLREFDTWTDFVTFARDNAKQRGGSHLNDDNFAGCTFDEAVNKALLGWQEGAEMITIVAAPIFDQLSSRIPKRQVRVDTVGGTVIVPRFLVGVPDHMMRYKQTRHSISGKGRRMIQIIYNQSTSGAISTEIMQARGATVAALVQLLEYAGFVTEVTLVDASRGFNYDKNLTWQMRVPLKRAGQLMDASRIAFGLSHPATLRRLAFGVMEGEPDFQSYGAPMEVTQWVEKGDIYIGAATYGQMQWQDADAARNWVVDQLIAQGIDLK